MLEAALIPANSLTCLCYHHVAARETDAVRGLAVTTPTDKFKTHIDWITRSFNVVDLETVLSGRLPPRALLITFDDAYRSVLSEAAPLLAARGLPAVLFLNPRPVVEDYVPLDNLLAVMGTLANRDAALTDAMAACGLDALPDGDAHLLAPGDREALRGALLARISLERDIAPDVEGLFLRPGDIAELAGRFGFEIANHTRSHVRTRVLCEAERLREIKGARDEIEALSGRPVRAFAFPWGDEADTTDAVLKVIRETGHRAIFHVRGRINTLGGDRPGADEWYRTAVADTTVAGLVRETLVTARLRSLRDSLRRMVS